MNKPRIFQIAYSDESRGICDPGFEILDNYENPRPDWFEYWPIRKFLLSQELESDTYYGFFSPNFGSKTELESAAVFAALKQRAEDVVIFSHFLDQSALFYNQIDHGEGIHPGFADIFVNTFDYKALPFPLIQTSKTIVFSNFFVAKPAFWKRWLAHCEKLFALAEAADTAIGMQLAGRTDYKGTRTTAFKVFCMERAASILLSLEPHWTSVAPLAYEMPIAVKPFEPQRERLIQLDLLKYAAQREPDAKRYLRLYRLLRQDILDKAAQQQQAASG